jgi:CxxC-x17-CxxC domain-containing protein
MYEDKIIHCRDCDETFTFTAGEQEFFASKGFDNEPTRCQPCRQRRKAGRSDRRTGFRERPQRQMFSAICDDCGQETQVPFEPSPDRPVYCRECLVRHRSS